MKKLILLIICFSASILKANAQIIPNIATGLGSAGFSETGRTVAIDPFGNIYIAGNFKNTIDFDPSANTLNLTANNSNEDIYIAKYTNAGQLLWAKNIGGSGNCKVFDIIADSTYCIIAGSFIGTTDFDPSAAVVSKTYAGGGIYGDCFFEKLDSAGNYQYVKTIGSSMNDAMKAITLDADNNIYIAGFVGATADMNPGSAVFNITNTSTYWNTFISKFDLNGNFTYAKQIKGNGSNPFDICLDKNNTIYITGEFSAACYFNPLSTTLSLTPGGTSSFYIAKYTNNGLYINAVKNDGTGLVSAQQIKVDADLNMYVAGFFSNTADFLLGTGSASYNGGLGKGFVVKYDSTFVYKWVNVFGNGGTFNPAYAMELDAANNVYVTGRFNGTNVDFDGSANTANLSATNRTAFIAVYNKQGDYLYAGKGSDANSAGNNLAYFNGKLYIIGEFNDSINTGFGTNTNMLYSNGGSDVFFASFNVLLSPLSLQSIVLQGSTNGISKQLNWQVNDVQDVNYFEVLASADNSMYKVVTTIPAINSLGYSYTDYSNNQYYTIKAVTKNSTTLMSNSVHIVNSTFDGMVAFANNKIITITNSIDFKNSDKIVLINAAGAVIHTTKADTKTCMINATHLPNGLYYVIVQQLGKSSSYKISLQ
jgi:hypothetical protein